MQGLKGHLGYMGDEAIVLVATIHESAQEYAEWEQQYNVCIIFLCVVYVYAYSGVLLEK